MNGIEIGPRAGRVALLLLLLTGTATLGARAQDTADAEGGVLAAPPPPSAAADRFIVRPGDVLEIAVWPDSAWSGRFPVEETGLVYLPVLGAVPAGDRTLAALRADLRDRYRGELKAPIVTITPVFRVSVIGAVNRPGNYEVTPTETLFDVISMAGGFREDAELDELRIIRDGRVYDLNAERALETGAAELALSLQSGDRIVVPRDRFQLEVRDVLFVLQSISLVISLLSN